MQFALPWGTSVRTIWPKYGINISNYCEQKDKNWYFTHFLSDVYLHFAKYWMNLLALFSLLNIYVF